MFPEDGSLTVPTIFTDKNGINSMGIQHHYYEIFKNKIVSYQPVWSFLVSNRSLLKNGDKLSEHYYALSIHYGYLLFNQNQITEAENSGHANNDDVFLITYFLFSFITSAAALIDLFAWIIHDLFDFTFTSNSQVTIHFREKIDNLGKKGKKFRKELLEKVGGKKLVDILNSEDIRKVLRELQIHRDIIVHRGTIHLMPYEDGRRIRMILKPIDPAHFREDTDRVEYSNKKY